MLEEHGTWLNALLPLLPEWAHGVVNVNVMTGWLAAAVLLVLMWRCARNLQLIPRSGWQTAGEFVWESMTGLCKEIIGPGGARFAPFLGTLFLYILLMNLFGIIPGFLSPTASLNMTAALALTTIIVVQYFGFRERGIRYLLHFVGEPRWLFIINIPIHVIGELSRILSLSFRLFGNIFGEDMVLAKFIALGAVSIGIFVIPVPLQLPMVLFHILVSLIQAAVFTMLAAVYIAGAVEAPAEESRR